MADGDVYDYPKVARKTAAVVIASDGKYGKEEAREEEGGEGRENGNGATATAAAAAAPAHIGASV